MALNGGGTRELSYKCPISVMSDTYLKRTLLYEHGSMIEVRVQVVYQVVYHLIMIMERIELEDEYDATSEAMQYDIVSTLIHELELVYQVLINLRLIT